MGELVPAQAGGAAGPRRLAVAATALRGLSRFAAARGIPPGREFLLDYDVIEAFCVAGLPGRASSTRGTYRSALYRLAAGVHGLPGQRPTPFAGAKAPAGGKSSPVPDRSGRPWLQELRHELRPHPDRRPGRAPAEPGPAPVQLHLRPPGRRHPGS